MNILFTTSFRRTMVFHGIATRLEKSGEHKVFWLSTGKRWTKWLLENGVSQQRILDITNYAKEWQNDRPLYSNEVENLKAIELFSQTTINRIILSDRLIRNKPEDYAIRYLSVSAREIEKFISANKIEIYFGERTWAIDLIADFVCRKTGVKSYAPHTIRIPSTRFTFFDGIDNNLIASSGDFSDDARKWASDFLDEFKQKKLKPFYFYSLRRIPLPRLEWFKRLIKRISEYDLDNHDETAFPISELIKIRIKEVFNYQISKRFNFFENPEEYTNSPYILLLLHVQPEASVDVLGEYHTNQLELAVNLARNAPSGYKVLVKEHSNALGNRGISFYKALKKIPSVRLVDPFYDTFKLLDKAVLTVSVSGTACFEAGLLGKHAACVSPMFFKNLLSLSPFNPASDEIANLISRIERGEVKAPDREEAVNFMAWLYTHSHEANLSDPAFTKEILSEENLDRAANGFLKIIEKLSKSAQLKIGN